ncbi:hypothetical protein WJX72_010506 [[Myrmecia] bisecta]|uniref:Uncharacterized protein n=1 Tax=[Myrmecia] bisecta TaxID=41462 RepID=A0AAW1PPQ4_9CHLO
MADAQLAGFRQKVQDHLRADDGLPEELQHMAGPNQGFAVYEAEELALPDDYQQRVGRFVPRLPVGWEAREVRGNHRKGCTSCSKSAWAPGQYYFTNIEDPWDAEKLCEDCIEGWLAENGDNGGGPSDWVEDSDSDEEVDDESDEEDDESPDEVDDLEDLGKEGDEYDDEEHEHATSESEDERPREVANAEHYTSWPREVANAEHCTSDSGDEGPTEGDCDGSDGQQLADDPGCADQPTATAAQRDGGSEGSSDLDGPRKKRKIDGGK